MTNQTSDDHGFSKYISEASISEEPTAQLRFNEGFLEQIWIVTTHKHGLIIDASQEWRAVEGQVHVE